MDENTTFGLSDIKVVWLAVSGHVSEWNYCYNKSIKHNTI